MYLEPCHFSVSQLTEKLNELEETYSALSGALEELDLYVYDSTYMSLEISRNHVWNAIVELEDAIIEMEIEMENL